MWSRERLTKNLATARLENVSPEVWTKIGKAAQKKKQNGKKREAKTRQCSTTDRNVLYSSGRVLQERNKETLSFQETEAKSCESHKIPKN